MQPLRLTGVSKHRLPDTLSNLSAVLIDGKETFIDNGAIHGKSRLEKGIRFVKDHDEVPNPRRIALVWVTLRRAIPGLGVNGMGASIFYIDEEAGIGYKDLADQVNKMDAAVRGKIMVEALTKEEHELLGRFILGQRPELWENATEGVWQQWLDEPDIVRLRARLAEAEANRERIRIEAESERLAQEAMERAMQQDNKEDPGTDS